MKEGNINIAGSNGTSLRETRGGWSGHLEAKLVKGKVRTEEVSALDLVVLALSLHSGDGAGEAGLAGLAKETVGTEVEGEGLGGKVERATRVRDGPVALVVTTTLDKDDGEGVLRSVDDGQVAD